MVTVPPAPAIHAVVSHRHLTALALADAFSSRPTTTSSVLVTIAQITTITVCATCGVSDRDIGVGGREGEGMKRGPSGSLYLRNMFSGLW